jgi:hypothetical protein
VNGKSTEIRVRLDDLLNKGKIDQNFQMLPGDVLIVPQSSDDAIIILRSCDDVITIPRPSDDAITIRRSAF